MSYVEEGDYKIFPPHLDRVHFFSCHGIVHVFQEADFSSSFLASALAAAASVQPLATQCFQLSNMFNPQT